MNTRILLENLSDLREKDNTVFIFNPENPKEFLELRNIVPRIITIDGTRLHVLTLVAGSKLELNKELVNV